MEFCDEGHGSTGTNVSLWRRGRGSVVGGGDPPRPVAMEETNIKYDRNVFSGEPKSW